MSSALVQVTLHGADALNGGPIGHAQVLQYLEAVGDCGYQASTLVGKAGGSVGKSCTFPTSWPGPQSLRHGKHGTAVGAHALLLRVDCYRQA